MSLCIATMYSNYGENEFDVATFNFGVVKCIFVDDNLLLLDNAMFLFIYMYYVYLF